MEEAEKNAEEQTLASMARDANDYGVAVSKANLQSILNPIDEEEVTVPSDSRFRPPRY